MLGQRRPPESGHRHERFAEALRAAIAESGLRALPLAGVIDHSVGATGSAQNRLAAIVAVTGGAKSVAAADARPS
jgi:hypothetical protein